jgi:hypothetical protein
MGVRLETRDETAIMSVVPVWLPDRGVSAA